MSSSTPIVAAPPSFTPAGTTAKTVTNQTDAGYKTWECLVCGFIYDEAKGWPDDGIAPGTRWEDVPADWECPDCGVGKDDFAMVEVNPANRPVAPSPQPATTAEPVIDWQQAPVVIIGTGLAGYNLAREFRKLNQTTPLILITADDGRFYSKPAVSTGLAKGKQPDQIATATALDMAEQLQADIRIFTRVTAIDATGHSLTTEQGETLHYGKLVLAAGARCVEPPMTGNGLNRVYHINNLLDYTRFRTALAGKQKVLVIWAGLIGSEYANDLIQAGYAVEAVEPMPSVLGTLLPAEASHSVETTLRNAGVNYHFGTVVERIDQDGQGIRATLANGETITADLVLSAVGVRPDLRLAEMAGLTCNRGIVTDRSLATSATDIYALGDCAEVEGQLLYYVAPLMEGSRVLAKVLTGNSAEVNYGVMPVVVKTTLHSITVVPPGQSEGSWQIDQAGENVIARYLSADGQLLGFALTGSAVKEKDQLAAQTQPLMQPR